MSLDCLDAAWEVKAIDGAGEGTFEGYASVFGTRDFGGDVVERGAFAESLKERRPAMLWQHDHERPIGTWQVVEEDSHGLHVKGKLVVTSTWGRDAYELMKAGALSGLSIGFSRKKGGAVWDDVAKVRRLTALNLHEISPVTFPMLDVARVSAVKADDSGMPTVRELEDALREVGLSRTDAKATVAALSRKGFFALRDAALDPDDTVRLLRAASQELKRNVRDQERAR